MQNIFDPKIGLKAEEAVSTRDVSSALDSAEEMIRALKEPMFVEDLIKFVQVSYPLTNDEVYALIQKVDAELKVKSLE